MKYLFIAEKPSLMRDVQSCYKNHTQEIIKAVGEIDFVALSGHVCTVGEPKDYPEWDCPWQDIEYPMIPKKWMIMPIKDKYKFATLKKIKQMAPSYDAFIVGTDSDVEGYGIYYLLENYLGLQKQKAVRFVEHSLTDKEILHSLLHMTDYHSDPTHVRFTQSFLLRSHADWLYGMNCTRKMTMRLDTLMTIGRVKAPTIKIIYDNSMAIENFKPRKYYNLTADYGMFTGVCVTKDGKPMEFEQVNPIIQKEIPKTGTIAQANQKDVYTHAPKLYDLPILQGEAGQTFGMTPSEVLETVQSLYEKHKVISYPRTQCRYVSLEKSKEFPDMLKKMRVFEDLVPFVDAITPEDIRNVQADKQVANDAEVAKESHDALLPTSKTPVLKEMTEKEIRICHLIYKRLLAQFLPKLSEQKTQLTIKHGEYLFVAQGKIIMDQGWRILYGELKDREIPELKAGSKILAKEIGFSEKITSPPKRLTQATLLLAMENIANQIEDKELKKSLSASKGIGTPATRDAIIKDIIRRGYMEDKGKKGLYITDLGKEYVENLSGIDIISPVFAARLDTEIKKIQRGEANYTDVYKKMLANLREICAQIDQTKLNVPQIPCPRCGEILQKEPFQHVCQKCGLQIPKQICGQTMTEELIKSLSEHKVTPRMKFIKKDKTKFEARIRLTDEGLKFDTSLDITCPYCGQGVFKGPYGYYCKCGLKIPSFIADHLSLKEAKKLIEEQYLPQKDGFVSKKGTTFSAALKLENKEVKFIFS